jgi:ribosomal protein L37AE/L43A
VSASTTVTDPREINPCPSCGDTTSVQPTPGISPRVKAWSCAACRTDWAIAVVTPRPFLEHLVASVELAAARSVLRGIIALAEQAPALPDDQVRGRLVDLARTARPGCRRG